MFALGLREGLEAALIVMMIALILRGSGHQRRLLVAVAAAVVICVAIVVGVRSAHALIDDTTRHTIKAIVAAIAIVALTSTASWVVRWTQTDHPPVDAAQASGLVVSAFLAVLREGLELAVFPAAGGGDRWAPGGPAMLLGVLTATTLGVIGYRLARESVAGAATGTAVLLALIAAGLATGMVRSTQAALGTDPDVFVEIGWLGALPHWLGDLVRGVFGWHATPSTGEVVAYGTYAVVAALVLARPAPRNPAREGGAITGARS
ncbi:MAG TPA: FTR1 family protein [Ilumatobacter sp.]|nr:FTR1 family protein [Ilumatobacter sp.]